jgi:hypothetical protein
VTQDDWFVAAQPNTIVTTKIMQRGSAAARLDGGRATAQHAALLS